MASISKETRNGRTLYRVEWRDGNKRRRKIRLPGELNNKKDAKAIASKIGDLVSASISRRQPDNAVLSWLNDIGDDLHAKLANTGIVKPRKSAKLDAFVADYVEQRVGDLGAGTIRNFHQVEKLLVEHFGNDCDMRAITPGDADAWRQSLAKKYAPATLNKHVKRAKQLFSSAVRCRVVNANPFADVVGGSEVNDERKQFIDRAAIEKALNSCPDAQWRAIIALARYGGLRCPSEVLRLKWSDINWESDRFRVTSPKTKRQGKPFRMVPMFPELRPFLSDAFEVAPAGEEYVITRYRDTNSNLRTHFERILDMAGVIAWPRLFQNLRASRETELANDFPLHVVTTWLGNSPTIAAKHYLQVTDEHFARAAEGGATGGDKVARNESQATASARLVPH